ncbi:MAG: phosphate regulon sensor histidine kinase PhoR [Gammaproteobacteria bacterium]
MLKNPFEDWGSALWRVALVAGVGALVGLFVGHLWWGVAGALAIELARQLANLNDFLDWLRRRNQRDPPDSGGRWGDAVSLVSRLHRRKQYHKQRILKMFRELRRSTASMPDGVVALNVDREILWFNRKAGELLGLRRKLDFGISLPSLVRVPEFARYLDQGDFGSSLRVHPRIGETTCLEFQGVPYGEGQLFLLVRDVTRQAQLETMRKDFVANASHELRSPLTVIAGYLDTISQDGGLPEELRPPVLEMRRQAERMTAIVADLLELSRLEASDEQVVGQPIDVAALLSVLRKDLVARDAGKHEVALSIEAPAGLMGDTGLIHSAFWNLADNASKYTSAGGKIALRWWVDELGGHFAVSDTGPGISPEHLPRLTERFYRVDPGRARDTGGSGLGLAIVRHVLQRHGAELKIESEEGRGSTFTCHFPRARLVRESSESK